MNSLTRIMSYDKTKIKNQENCNCEECVNIGVKNQTVEYSSLSEEEIDKIINEQYDYKDEKTKKFIRKALRKHGDRYDYSNVIYIKSDVKVEIICRVKTHKPFSQTPHQHISRGQGCPKCNSPKGEVVVRNWLIKNKIEFEEQKRFDDCRDKRKLPFDFYLPRYNLCIEYDGEQHFNAHSFNCKKESKKQRLENLKKLQSHDQIKNNYCKSHNINLLRIRYDENVEEKLMKYFQTYGSLKERTIFDL